jgi:hypothetical protein
MSSTYLQAASTQKKKKEPGWEQVCQQKNAQMSLLPLGFRGCGSLVTRAGFRLQGKC